MRQVIFISFEQLGRFAEIRSVPDSSSASFRDVLKIH